MYVILNLMWKLLIVPLVVLVFGVSGLFLYQNFQTKQVPQPSPTTQVSKAPSATTEVASSPPTNTASDPCEVLIKGNSDIPPLYDEGITWEKTQVTEYEIPLGEEGSRKMSGCLIESENTTDDMSLQVIGFYDESLQNNDWDILVTAEGVYSSTNSYKKDNKYIVIRRYVPDSVPTSTGNPPLKVELFHTK